MVFVFHYLSNIKNSYIIIINIKVKKSVISMRQLTKLLIYSINDIRIRIGKGIDVMFYAHLSLFTNRFLG